MTDKPVEECAVTRCHEPVAVRDLCRKHYKSKKFRARSEAGTLKPKPRTEKVFTAPEQPDTARRIVTLDYAPRKQFLPFHNRKERFAILVTHRRAGKSVASVNDLIRRAIKTPNGRFAYVAPFFSQAKDVAFDYLTHYASPLLAGPPNVSELRVDLINGATIRLYGGDNPDRLRGIGLDGVVLDEMGDMRPGVWSEVIRPALADRQGWATFLGTPRGHNEFWELFKIAKQSTAWFKLELKASETGILPQSELDAAKESMGREAYDQEFETSFESALVGAFYADELERARKDKRIAKIPIDRSVLVHTAWDLGVSDSTAIWFIQVVGKERRLIDYAEHSGAGLDFYAQLLREKNYVYGTHYFPHDVAVKELATGMSRADTLRGLGIEPEIGIASNVLDGINSVRRLLDSSWIDPERCERGLEALKAYRREFDDKQKIFRPKALHNWASHGADALRTFATGFEERAKAKKKTKLGRWFPRTGKGSPWLGA